MRWLDGLECMMDLVPGVGQWRSIEIKWDVYLFFYIYPGVGTGLAEKI